MCVQAQGFRDVLLSKSEVCEASIAPFLNPSLKSAFQADIDVKHTGEAWDHQKSV